MTTTREQILSTAAEYVSNDRNQQYGEPEDNFQLIGGFWQTYLMETDNPTPDAFDVAMMLALLKIARLTRRPKSLDSAIDLAGYAACAGEILQRLNDDQGERKAEICAESAKTLEELARIGSLPGDEDYAKEA